MYFALRLTALTAVAATCAAFNPNYEVPKTKAEYEKAMKKLGLTPSRPYNVPNPADANTNQCAQCCAALMSYLPKSAFNSSDPRYAKESADYWSAIQAAQTPSCYVRPNFAQQVAGSVLTSEFYKCPFAVKSGGHAAFTGASNINGGFTIDLQNLKSIKISKDQTVTKVGTGHVWGDVYSKLEKKNLTVIGGRVYGIGVGGLTLGGGISFFSGLQGWACDNVVNYQVVLAGGQVTDVNETSYPDLYFALRGGGNNFGVVTRFDLDTYPQGQMWGGELTYSESQTSKLLTAFVNFANDAPSDPNAAMYLALAYTQGKFLYAAELTYAKPTANPSIFSDFYSIPNTGNTTAITSQSHITKELNKQNPSGFQETYTTATFDVDYDFLEKVVAIFKRRTAQLNGVQGLVAAITMQLITPDMAQHFSKRGGNALGISPSETPLLLIDLSASWTSAADNNNVIVAMNNIRRLCVRASRRRNLYNPYIYQNYASAKQRPLQSYGQANLAKLVAASKKYDPQQVFQNLEPGYFKLSD